MRTTVTLDPDVAALVHQRMRDLGISFKQAVNDAIRAGVAPRSDPTEPFRVRTSRMGRPALNLDRALQIAAEDEDDEMLRKMRMGK